MNSLRQLAREPMKTAAGILVIALAVAILVTCLGQAMAAGNIGAAVDKLFTTIALPTGRYQLNEYGYVAGPVSQEVQDVISGIIQEYPELVEEAKPVGLASAYSPELVADNYTKYPCMYVGDYAFYSYVNPSPEGTPYTCAMMEITLEEIREPEEQADGSIQVILRGPILSVVGLQEGFNDPEGRLTAHVTLSLPNAAALKELNLKTGQRCLVYTTEYYDSDWCARSQACKAVETGEITIEEMDPTKLYFLTEEAGSISEVPDPLYYQVAYYMDGTDFLILMNCDLDGFRAVNLPAENPAVMPEYTGQEGSEVYTVPTVAVLTGSVEEFLASEEGEAWREMLEMIEVNSHAFPVMGVTRLNAVPSFNRGVAEVQEGREFTTAELEKGANVCILSQTVAELAGLTVGDTITLNYYQNDENLPFQKSLSEGYGAQNPTAAMYFEKTTPFAGEAETYTIVGLYRLDNAWGHPSDNLYSFTPNTIFVPQKSVKSEMEFSEVLQFGTIQLKNGSIEEFTEAMFEAGYPYLYEFYDQGYTLVMENLQNYSAIARQAMTIGIVVWAMVVLLFLVIFPARQGSAIARMGSLGTTRAQKMGHVLVSALGILAPGTVIGAGTGILLWETVVGGLTGAVAVDLDLSLNVPMIGLIALAQLAAAMAAVAVMALVMTRERSLMKKR